MKLVYFWVDKVHDIKVNQGINLGSEWVYDLKENPENPDEKILTRSVNQDFVPDFWGDWISNVSALVGENGSGKTTIFDDLKYYLTNGNVVFGELIFEDGQDVYSSHRTFKVIDEKLIINKLPKDFKPTVIYYSPVYDFAKRNSSGIDVSSNHLLPTDIDDYTSSFVEGFDTINYHRSNEILRQLDVLERLPDVLRRSNIPLPKELRIKLFGISESLIPGKENPYVFDNFPSEFRTWAETYFDVEDDNPFRKEIYAINDQSYEIEQVGIDMEQIRNFQSWKAYITSLLKIFLFVSKNAQYKAGNDMIKLQGAPSVQPGIDNSEAYLNSAQEVTDFGTKSPETTSRSEEFLFQFLRNQTVFPETLLNFFLNLKKILFLPGVRIEENIGSIGTYDEVKIVLSVEDVRDFIFNFYQPLLQNPTYLKGLASGGQFLEFDWHVFSHGESARFNLFSRLNAGYNEIIKNASGSEWNYLELEKRVYPKELILLLDEPDHGWHLTWQRELVKDLVSYAPDIFLFPDGSKPQIQIIFSTHSPVSLSDIPEDHVTLLSLKRDDDVREIRITSGKELATGTFGANIHDLFKESFFMREGFMGKFAEEKIKAIISELTKSTEEKLVENEEDLKKRIGLIGEPVLKQKLLEMLEFKLNKTMDEVKLIDQAIKDLEERKRRIEDNKREYKKRK